jgi:hypothetical protein
VDFTIRWGGTAEDVSVCYRGAPDPEAMVASFLMLRDAPEYRDGLRILLDYRTVDWTGLSAAEMQQVAEAFNRAPRSSHRHRVASVVDRKLAFGLLRVVQAHIDEEMESEGGFFYDFESARAWLNEEN